MLEVVFSVISSLTIGILGVTYGIRDFMEEWKNKEGFKIDNFLKSFVIIACGLAMFVSCESDVLYILEKF